MNSWLFPPQTREVRFDEKWAFVGKKEKNSNPDNPDDATLGDNWDHLAPDAEHKLVVSMVPGKRIKENIQALVNDFKQHTVGRMMNLITTDEYAAYPDAILRVIYDRRTYRRPHRRQFLGNYGWRKIDRFEIGLIWITRRSDIHKRIQVQLKLGFGFDFFFDRRR